MKYIIIVFLFLSFSSFSQGQGTLIKYKWGLEIIPNFQESLCKDKVAAEYQFKYQTVAGCIVSESEVAKWTKHNQDVEEQLQKRHGENWRDNFMDKVLACKYKNYEANIGYKSLNDTTFEEDDRILAPSIYFELSRVEVLESSLDSLKIIANFIKKHPNLMVEIDLFLDQQGSDEANQRLSERRAKSLYVSLKMLIDDENINNYTAKGYGETSPIVSLEDIKRVKNDVDLIERLFRINQRVELKVIEMK
jgi:outer membrane protein OmpA-like peptidoglycan-associated protein